MGEIGLNTGASLPLVERWNGARWSIQRVPKRLAFLDGVSCTSRRACVAIGQFVSARWNGSRWSALQIPNAGIAFAISCVSTHSCQLAGETNDQSRTFAARWNGLGWKREQIPTPNSGNDYSELDGVSCTSATECIGVRGLLQRRRLWMR